MLLAFFGLITGLALLVYGADRFVIGAGSTARNMGISPLIIGLTIVGFATSAPEILVGSVAAWEGRTEMAIGNAIGSNITNIALVLGATAALFPITVNSKTLRREYLFMLIAIVLALLVLLDQTLSRTDSGILLLMMIIVTWIIIVFSKRSKKTDLLLNELQQELGSPLSVKKSLGLLAAGLVLLLGGAELLVRCAIIFAKHFGLSDLVIGLTIIAVGTSLPELAISIYAVLNKRGGMSVGNLIGSNILDTLLPVGLAAVIYPVTVASNLVRVDMVALFALSFLVLLLFRRTRGLQKPEATILIVAYGAYLAYKLATV